MRYSQNFDYSMSSESYGLKKENLNMGSIRAPFENDEENYCWDGEMFQTYGLKGVPNIFSSCLHDLNL